MERWPWELSQEDTQLQAAHSGPGPSLSRSTNQALTTPKGGLSSTHPVLGLNRSTQPQG